MSMKHRRLGSTDLELSEVGFGVWTLTTGWWGNVEESEALKMLRRALDLGITFYDTADTYGDGYGETLLARAFEGQREEIVIATKFGYDICSPREHAQGERKQRWDPAFVRMACERSLKRLGADRIDLWQLHNPRMDAIKDDRLWDVLDDLRAEDRVRHIGVALGPAIGWREEGLGALKGGRVAAIQTVYNALEQEPARAFFPATREVGAGVLVRVPHSSGLLEGNLTPDTKFDPRDHRSYRPREWLTDGLKKVDLLGFLTKSGRRTLGQAAVQFVLAEPSVASVLPNIYNAEQLGEFAAAPEKPPLIPEEVRRVVELYDENFGLAKAAVSRPA
jgi:aryl-alcohol dehydrogenase-like predicted oxidoreductase